MYSFIICSPCVDLWRRLRDLDLFLMVDINSWRGSTKYLVSSPGAFIQQNYYRLIYWILLVEIIINLEKSLHNKIVGWTSSHHHPLFLLIFRTWCVRGIKQFKPFSQENGSRNWQKRDIYRWFILCFHMCLSLIVPNKKRLFTFMFL